MDKVRIGIVGIGNIGSSHCKYLNAGDVEGAVLAAVCDINPERLKWAEETLSPTVARFDEAEKMFASGLIDAAIIAVPHYYHCEYVIKAFEAGLHAISEKPEGAYTNQAVKMNEAAKKYGKVFSMMFNQRTNPCYQKLREMVQSGELGRIKRTNWIITDWYRTQYYYNSGGWRATWSGEGGGVLLNQCPHNLDLWQWTCGMPKSVRAFCHFGKWHDIEVEDEVTAYVEYENGATGLFVTTTGECPGTNRYEVIGEMGKVVIEGTTLTFDKNDVSDIEFCKSATDSFKKLKTERIVYEFPDKGPQHKGITQNFVNAILHGEPLLAPGPEGINELTLSNAMYMSSWLDKTIELPLDADLFEKLLAEKAAASTYKKPEAKAKVSETEGSY